MFMRGNVWSSKNYNFYLINDVLFNLELKRKEKLRSVLTFSIRYRLMPYFRFLLTNVI